MREHDAGEREYEAPLLEDLGTVEDYTAQDGIGISLIIEIN